MTIAEEPLTVKFYPHNHISHTHCAEERGLADMNKTSLTAILTCLELLKVFVGIRMTMEEGVIVKFKTVASHTVQSITH